MQDFKIGSLKTLMIEKCLHRVNVLCNGCEGSMQNKLNFWIINFFLVAVTSFLLNGGVFAGNRGEIALNKGNFGAIKLSGKNNTTLVKAKSLIVTPQDRKKTGQAVSTRTRQKENK